MVNSRILGLAGRAAAAAAMAATGVLVLAGPAASVPPDEAAWWSFSNRGGEAPAPPPPPDVKPGDLFVEGSRGGPAVAAFGSAPGSAQAVAGLAFEVPEGALVDSLVLRFRGSPPSSASVSACRTTKDFVSESNGEWADAPPYDCQGEVLGKVKDETLVFDGIGTLVRDDRLSVVLIPDYVDRLVLRKPGPNALQMDDRAAAPPMLSGPPAPSGGATTGESGSAPVSGSSFSGGELSGVDSSGPAGLSGPPPAPMSAPAGEPPAVAAAPGTNAPAVPATAPAAAHPLLPTNWQRFAACLLIAAQVAGFLLLHRRRLPALAASAPGVGGRLRPPDVTGAQSALSNRGVGRFKRDRGRAAPRL